jgi:acyl dehydratase
MREATMLDRSLIGLQVEPRSVVVDKEQLKFFAKATDEANPIYSDEAAATAAGYASLPAPPTFLFCLFSLAPSKENLIERLDIDLGRVLHGEQFFTYRKPIHAGDRITFTGQVTDIFDKKGGALEFVVTEYEAANQKGEIVGITRTVTVVRNS